MALFVLTVRVQKAYEKLLIFSLGSRILRLQRTRV